MIPPEHKNTVLIGLAAVLAVQVPTTIQAIPDTLIRACFMVGTLALVMVLALFARPPKRLSWPPKYDRDSILDLAEEIRRQADEQRSQDTPRETPGAKKQP
jgi:hypothetical protein